MTPILETPLGSLVLVEMYLYYDGPRLFAAVSNNGQLFLVLWYGSTKPNSEDWLLLPLSRPGFELLRRGGIDLRQAILAPGSETLYVLTTSGKGASSIRAVTPAELDPEDLPEDGEFLSDPGEELEDLELLLGRANALFARPHQEAAE